MYDLKWAVGNRPGTRGMWAALDLSTPGIL